MKLTLRKSASSREHYTIYDDDNAASGHAVAAVGTVFSHDHGEQAGKYAHLFVASDDLRECIKDALATAELGNHATGEQADKWAAAISKAEGSAP